MRKTKIICTIGPASDSLETLERMCLAGMNVARLNFSHGTHPEHLDKIQKIKAVREKLGLPVAILLDTKGPEYRIRTFKNGKITLLEFDMPEPEWSATNQKPFGTMPAHEVPVETDGLNPQHIGVVNAWGGAILRGEKLVASGEEGIRGLELSNAMHLSAFLGKKITLPIDEDLYYEELMKKVKASTRKPSGRVVYADTSKTYGGNK